MRKMLVSAVMKDRGGEELQERQSMIKFSINRCLQSVVKKFKKLVESLTVRSRVSV